MDLLIPSVILLSLMLLFHETSFDHKISTLIYSPSSNWIYRNNFILEKIFHKGGVIFSSMILVVIAIRLLLLKIKARPEQKKQRDYLCFILISTIMSILIVFLLKRITTIPCPWDTVGLGGDKQVPHLWEMFSPSLPKGGCFPAGHSSGGYGLLSIYFGHNYIYGKKRFITLLPGVIIGIIFGLTQIARGAHYPSHDLATILISIFSAWVTTWMYSYYNNRHEI